MRYQSTRDKSIRITSTEAILRGLSTDGGLYVPEELPRLTRDDIERVAELPYNERAAVIIGKYLDDFESKELGEYTEQAYSRQNFDHPQVAPLHEIDKSTHFLELWHGPTSAFKDMALQVLPYLLTASQKKTGEERQVCILVATSGDTGKAALEGFADVPGTRIMVFYPHDGVSDIQKLQMTTQSGSNVNVTAVEGNFDDSQAGVKAIFSDESLRCDLDTRGYFLSSANSINWGRLVPQIVYYISAYCDLINDGKIKNGEEINFCVPTGNFGNILAGFYAGEMGLPINKLICASNRNDVLCEFIKTGIYNKNRPFYTTISPSMDIVVSSNLERLLFELSGKDDLLVTDYMKKLADSGRYEVSKELSESIRDRFAAGVCTEDETKSTIASVFEEHKYLIDTHTAVAYKVLCGYRSVSGDERETVVVSTANAYKFCGSVLEALGIQSRNEGIALIEELTEATGITAPVPLAGLRGKEERFTESTAKNQMKDAVMKFLEK